MGKKFQKLVSQSHEKLPAQIDEYRNTAGQSQNFALLHCYTDVSYSDVSYSSSSPSRQFTVATANKLSVD